MDMCALGCGPYSQCRNYAANQRECTCLSGYELKDSSQPTVLTGSMPFIGCQGMHIPKFYVHYCHLTSLLAINPCTKLNGGCEEICVFIGPGERRCDCSDRQNAYLFPPLTKVSCLCNPGYNKTILGNG